MRDTISLKARPLTREGFAPYGDVIQTADAQHSSMNAGALERYYDLAGIEVGADSGGRPLISIARSRKTTALPLKITFLERHPLGSQAIYPLFTQAMLVVVAPIGEVIDANDVRAFYSDGSQGINFRTGVWHLPIVALQDGQDFIIVDRGGPGQNCDEFHFDEKIDITLSALDEQAANVAS